MPSTAVPGTTDQPPHPPHPERRRLRAAILGAGMIGEVHRRAALLAGAEVVGVLASSPTRSAEVGAQWGVHGYADLDEVLADDVDVVHVCTPNAQHAPAAAAVLATGKHVVCEKPLGTSLAEAESLAAQAAASGLVATVPFVYRYHPLVRELRERTRLGEFGTWNLLHGSYLQDWMLSPDASGWRVDPAAGGPSRAFADIGSHWCDLVEFVTGTTFADLVATVSIAIPQRPAAGGKAFSGASGGDLVDVTTEDSALVLLRTTDGVPASTVISQVSAGRKNRLWFELDGSRGSAVFDQENPETVWLGGPEVDRVLHRDPNSGSADQRRLATLPAGHAQGYAQCFELFVADTYAAIRGEEPVGLPTFADGARSAAIVDAVLRSVDVGTWTPISNGASS